MPFTCNLCHEKFCPAHRLPENHDCPRKDIFWTDEYRKAKLYQSPPRAQQQPAFAFASPKAIPFARTDQKKAEMEHYERVLFMNPALISFGRETVDLLIAFLLIFWGISFYGIFTGQQSLASALAYGLAVAPAFILHELGHKYMAMHYGRYARFSIIKNFALLTFFMGFLPFFIGTPGATMILGRPPSKRENGLFSIAGPSVNFTLALVFLLIFPIARTGPEFFAVFVDISIFVNIILGLFNLLPFSIIDGKKIWTWSRPIWFTAVGLFMLLLLLYLPFSIYLAS